MKRSVMKRIAFVVALLSALVVVFAPSTARADEPEAFARVVVDSAELRSGPGVSYHVIYNVQRGETLAIDGRQSAGFWLRVVLPDGPGDVVIDTPDLRARHTNACPALEVGARTVVGTPTCGHWVVTVAVGRPPAALDLGQVADRVVDGQTILGFGGPCELDRMAESDED